MNAEYIENNIKTLWVTVQDLRRHIDVLNERQSHAAAYTTPTGLIGAPDNVGRKCVLDAVEVTEEGTRHFIEYFEPHRPSTTTEPVVIEEADYNINAIPQTEDGTFTNGEVASGEQEGTVRK